MLEYQKSCIKTCTYLPCTTEYPQKRQTMKKSNSAFMLQKYWWDTFLKKVWFINWQQHLNKAMGIPTCVNHLKKAEIKFCRYINYLITKTLPEKSNNFTVLPYWSGVVSQLQMVMCGYTEVKKSCSRWNIVHVSRYVSNVEIWRWQYCIILLPRPHLQFTYMYG